MRDIEVFYHMFVSPDHLGDWHWWIDQQLGSIRKSNLHKVATVNLALTIPRNVMNCFGIPFYINNMGWRKECTFEEKIKDYISHRYPWVKFTPVRDISEPNIGEGYTYSQLYNKVMQGKEFDILYFHNKGSLSGFSPQVANWRELLNYLLIENWTECVQSLKTADVVGVQDAQTASKMCSGNFWWSKSEHLRNLPEPVSTDKWATDPDLWPNGWAYRYAWELWPMLNNAKAHYIYSTNIDHYMDYCFVEDIKKTKGV